MNAVVFFQIENAIKYLEKHQIPASLDDGDFVRIQQAICNAMDSWTGCDWETGLEGEALKKYQEDCQEDSAHAAHKGKHALDAADQPDGLCQAWEDLEEASKLERKYGDDPTWQVPRKMVEEIIISIATNHYIRESYP